MATCNCWYKKAHEKASDSRLEIFCFFFGSVSRSSFLSLHSDSMPSALLFGAGAVGAAYLLVLERSGAEVTAICRSNYAAAKERGFVINSSKWGQGNVVHPRVARTVQEAAEMLHAQHEKIDKENNQNAGYDYLLIASKAFPGSTDPPVQDVVRPAVGKNTVIALLQNGIGIEEEWKDAYPENPLVSCAVYLPSHQTEPGTIAHGNLEKLECGMYPSTDDIKHAQAFADMMKRGGSDITVFEDVQGQRWSKLLVNAVWNPSCALTLNTDVGLLASSPEAENFAHGAMSEVAAVARAHGYEWIDEKEVTRQLNRNKARIGTKGVQPSMLIDVKLSRPMEVEAILGNTVRIGQKKGVSVIRLETLYVLAKARSDAISRINAGTDDTYNPSHVH
jgi:2-dehydropantoate 2-reductase